MKYYVISLYSGRARKLTEAEFKSRKAGLGRGIQGEGMITFRGDEELLIKQPDSMNERCFKMLTRKKKNET